MTAKENDLLKTLEMCIEMFARGYEFEPIDINVSQAENFVVNTNGNKNYYSFCSNWWFRS